MENPKRCDNCCFSTWIVGVDRPVLTCRQKAGFVGKWRSLRCNDKCPNFYPTTNCRLNLNEPRRIPITQGRFAIVDGEDYYQLAKYRWTATDSDKPYASRRSAGKSIKMHRWIMNAPDELVVDHIDHNRLNNRKANLRLCTIAQNNYNATPRKHSFSKYKGVCWNKKNKKWVVTIRYNKIKYDLGYFDNEIVAAKAYDKKAKEFHREFAYLNFPPVASKL